MKAIALAVALAFATVASAPAFAGPVTQGTKAEYKATKKALKIAHKAHKALLKYNYGKIDLEKAQKKAQKLAKKAGKIA